MSQGSAEAKQRVCVYSTVRYVPVHTVCAVSANFESCINSRSPWGIRVQSRFHEICCFVPEFLVRSFAVVIHHFIFPITQNRTAKAKNIMSYEVVKSEQEWEAKLSPEEYKVLRLKSTERPGTGEYDKFYPKEGYFACRACSNPLYSAQSKFNSGCGWPAFDKCYKDSVNVHMDCSLGMVRKEIVCHKCGGHLGHVFTGENLTATNERHCVNSISVKFVKGQQAAEEEVVASKTKKSK